MSTPTESRKPSLGKLSVTPRTVSAEPQQLIRREPLLQGQDPSSALPLLFEPARPGVDLLSWARANRGVIDADLRRHGGLLFRGFAIDSPERFAALIEAVAGEALEYKERSSPRSAVSGHVYTSTDYPADQPIFLHNENSYAHTWPLKIFFFCLSEPETGGETPIADVRRVYRRLPQEIRDRFRERGVLYVRNFSDQLGLSWQTVFQTDDRREVEESCRIKGYDFEWVGENRLRTRRRGRAFVDHPKTGEPVWFNHATFFHVSTLPAVVRDGLLQVFAEEDLPNQTFYGDGSPIEPEVLETQRAAYRAETVVFPWQKGDVLLLDNMLVAHARAPFTGPRKVLVGMAEPFAAEALA